jgi:hypothetical protein
LRGKSIPSAAKSGATSVPGNIVQRCPILLPGIVRSAQPALDVRGNERPKPDLRLLHRRRAAASPKQTLTGRRSILVGVMTDMRIKQTVI